MAIIRLTLSRRAGVVVGTDKVVIGWIRQLVLPQKAPLISPSCPFFWVTIGLWLAPVLVVSLLPVHTSRWYMTGLENWLMR